ncbi:hypothetical protein [Trujillonella endophytica]|uniref:Uncharacterized protein n=1 Tax=Trujillonella endophytica TaxID=673521 RepID=A0A1H8R032_9ACTN|nr:hypothetical protein [Trujillella endophytica]SEO59805.1 hypothetical protein SAMN05660991_00918 [Trujillella endophytica]
MTTLPREGLLLELAATMGGFRAEQFSGELYDLFTTPTYWPALLTSRPCLLVGGRGTGKTTVLRGLSYEGQARLAGTSVEEWPLIGLYWRIDTTVVTAFRGAGLSEEAWVPIFSHYVNLTLTRLLCEFASWQSEAREVYLDASVEMARACRSLHLPPAHSFSHALELLDDELASFEAYINNVRGANTVELSMLGRPVELLVTALRATLGIGDKQFAFLVDEYENLEDYQQRVINTLIKHSGEARYTFKVGMRETGHRERRTLNVNESLSEPADYAYIDISRRLKESDFADFAEQVCNDRLGRVRSQRRSVADIKSLLPALSEADEAQRLGISARLVEAKRRLGREGAPQEVVSAFSALDPLAAYLTVFWNEGRTETLAETVADALANPREWSTRLTNYQHAMLFTIRRGMRGHRKYYAGWDTYVQLADGNIRYLLQLVNEALERHVLEERLLDEPVSVDVQTNAAQEVGRRIVQQLPGVGARGAQVTKLILGFGRIFQVMAVQPEGHTPEVTQLRVGWLGADARTVEEVEDLLAACVMHLAMLRFPGDKMAAVSGETRSFDYQLHPIFAPFFGFSYRRKRRISVDVADILQLATSDSSRTIRKILQRSNRDSDLELPEQLALFRGYYHDSPE